MGEVFRARDSRLGRDVALKILPESLAREPERLHRFGQEARAVAALNHPNILAVFDIGQHNGLPYLVSELLEGRASISSTDVFTYDVAKDGKSFLVNRYVRPDRVAPLTILLHAAANPQ